MRAKIPPQKRLSRDVLKDCVAYANSLQNANNIRIFKLACYVLHNDFGFGGERLRRFITGLDKLIRDNAENEVFWEHVDREMKQLGMNLADEKYQDIVGEWKKRNGF